MTTAEWAQFEFFRAAAQAELACLRRSLESRAQQPPGDFPLMTLDLECESIWLQ